MMSARLLGLVGGLVLLAGCTDPVVVAPPVEEPKPADGVAERSEPAPKPAKKRGAITEVDLNRLLQLQDDGRAYLIDVRPRLFYGLGHLPDAVNVPKKSFPLSLLKEQAAIDAAVASGKVLVLYCQNVECPDGYSVGKEMVEMGYSVSLYKGGWEEWKQMGF